MLVKREKYYIRRINKIGNTYYGRQKIRRTSFWLLGTIPLYVKNEVLSGDFEN